jgi:hypothetical protein
MVLWPSFTVIRWPGGIFLILAKIESGAGTYSKVKYRDSDSRSISRETPPRNSDLISDPK